MMRLFSVIRSHKKLLVVSLSVIALAAIINGCAPGTPQPRGWSGVVVSANALYLGSRDGRLIEMDTSSGARLWAAPLPLGAQRSGGAGCGGATPIVAIYGTPALKDDMVYVGGYVQEGNASYGKVFAFTSGRDEPKWVYPRDSYLGGPIVGGLVVSEDKVYFGAADGRVYALDAGDGHKIAEFQTGDRVWSTPAVKDGVVYIGSFDKKLYALDANTLQPTKFKEFPTDGTIIATPLVEGGTVYFGSFDRYLYAIDAESGSLKWRFLAENWFWAEPLEYNNVIYAPCLDGRIYVLDPATGSQLIPPLTLGSPISSSPVVVENKVVVATESGRIYTVDTSSYRLSELTNLGQNVYAPLSSSGGTIFVHTEQDALFAIDVATGAQREFRYK